MNALRLDPTERTFAQLYEPRRGPIFTRKTLIAIGITAACYGAIGFYLVNQKYEIAPYDPPSDDAVVVTSYRPLPPPLPAEQKPSQAAPTPAPTRTAANVSPTVESPLPLMPWEPLSNAIPATIAPSPPPETPAAEPTASPPPGVIRNPVWISRPTPEQVGSLYPSRAADRGVAGSATLLCGIRANGTMTDCQVIEESPAGWQFGRSALSMARYFRISPKTVDGQAVEGFRVRIPVSFSLAE